LNVDQAYECFRFSHAADRLGHAFLVCADPRREGMEFTGRVLPLLFCTGHPAPCGKCQSCRMAAKQTHPDLVMLEPKLKSRQIAVEHLRDFLKFFNQTSYMGGWKAGVIVCADRLMDAAANALLKTLEEPPPRCLFLLLTEHVQSLLPTIRSRCQRMDIHAPEGVRDEALTARVLTVLSDPDGLGAVGISRRMAALFREIKQEAEAQVRQETGESGKDDEDDVIKARVESLYQESRTAAVRAMLLWHRDILMLACGTASDALYHPEQDDVLRQRAAGLSRRGALKALAGLEKMHRRLERNLQEGPLLDQWCFATKGQV